MATVEMGVLVMGRASDCGAADGWKVELGGRVEARQRQVKAAPSREGDAEEPDLEVVVDADPDDVGSDGNRCVQGCLLQSSECSRGTPLGRLDGAVSK